MKYVNMNEVAFDDNKVAFPGLGNCQGFVYHTSAGLFAYHAYGNPLDSEGKAEAFGMFVHNHMRGRDAVGVCLYGACPNNRYTASNGQNEQRTELQMVARRLGFKGEMKGHRWDLSGGQKTTYVEFDLDGSGVVTVSRQDFTDQDRYNDSGSNPSSFDHKSVKQWKDANSTGYGQFAGCSCVGTDQVIQGVQLKDGELTVVRPEALGRAG